MVDTHASPPTSEPDVLRQRIQALEAQLAQCELERATAQQAQQTLLALVDQADAVCFEVDDTWRFRYANATAAATFGHSPAALLGQDLWECYPQLLGTVWETHYRQAMAEWRPRHFTAQDVLSNRWLDVSVYPAPQGIAIYAVETTARHRLVAELEAEKAHLAAVLEQIPVGVIIAEARTGRLLLGNRQVGSIWRHPYLPAEGVSDYAQYQGFHADGTPYRPEEWPLARAIVSGEVVVGEEIVIQRGDGTRGAIAVNAAPVCDVTGAVVAGVVVFDDISERKQAVQALREQEALLRAFLDQLPLGAGLFDLNGRWRMRNKYLRHLVGETIPSRASDWQKTWQTWAEDGTLLEPDQWPGARALRGETVSPGMEFLRTADDGTQRWMRINAAPFRDEIGAITGGVVVIQDIDDRKRNDEVLRRQTELTHTVLENSTACLFMMDAQGYCIYMNRTAEAMFGWSQEEICQKPLHDIVHHHHPDGRPYPMAECPIDRALPENSDIREHEDWFIRRNGEFFPVLVAASPIFDATDRPVSTVVEVRDMTEHRRAEEALRQSEARQAFLLRLSDTLRPLDDPVTIQYEAARVLGEHVGASRVGYAEDQGDGQTIAVARNYTDGVSGIEGLYSYDDYGSELLQAFRAGRTVVRPDIQNHPALTDAEKEAHAVLALGATVNVPLVKGGQLVGVFFVHQREARPWTDAEVTLFEEVAERTWAAVVRARTEAALRESEERFRLASSAARIGVYSRNLRTGQDYWSPEFLAIYGVNPGEPLPLREGIPAAVHPEDRVRVLAEAHARLRYSATPEFASEHRLLLPDGEVRWVMIRGQMEFDAQDQPIASRGLVLDITERKRAEEALRESERQQRELVQSLEAERGRLAAILENLPVGLWLADQAGRLVGKNEQADRIWAGDAPLSESIAKYTEYHAWYARSRERLNPEDYPMAIALRTGQPVEPVELQIQRFDGSEGTIVVSAAPIRDSQGQLLGAVGINVDITQRKLAEEALRQLNEHLEEMVAARTVEVRLLADQLLLAEQKVQHRLAQVLHSDLQQLLYSARMHLKILQEELPSAEGSAGASAFAVLHGIVADSLRVIRQLTLDVNPPLVQDEPLVDLLNRLGGRMEQLYGLSVVVEAQGSLSPLDPSLRRRLYQSVRELLFNVVKHAGVSEAQVTLTQAGETLQVVVEDQGQGFDVATAGQAATSEGGYGLAYVRDRMCWQGGTLAVESAPGQGTRTTLRIPLPAEDAVMRTLL